MLELKLNGEDITSDEYLENALKLIPGTGGLGWEGWGGKAGERGLELEEWGRVSSAKCVPWSVESFLFPMGWRSAEVLIGHYLITFGKWCLISFGKSRAQSTS